MQGVEITTGKPAGSVHASRYENPSPEFMRKGPFGKVILKPPRTAFCAGSLIAAAMLLASVARAISGEDFWESTLDRMSVLWAVTNGHATAYSPAIKDVQSKVVQRLQNDSAFMEQVRRSLRNDGRVWVRSFAAGMLLKALGEHDAEDAVYILSDPDLDVRAFGIMGVRIYGIVDAACALPAGLLSKDAVERSAAIRGIRKLMGWKGLPYYAQLVYDSNTDVASEAAKAFRSCKSEDAAPHLLRYLRQYGKSRNKRDVTKCAIGSLCELYGEPVIENSELKRAVADWVKRLEKDGGRLP